MMYFKKSVMLLATGCLSAAGGLTLAADHKIELSKSNFLHPEKASEIQLDISKLSDSNTIPSSFYISLTKDNISAEDPVFENWSVSSPFSECRYAHENYVTLSQSSRGSRFVCDNIDVLNLTGSSNLTINLTPDELTHFNLVVAAGSSTLGETLVVNPELIDSDADGALDREEILAGSDKNDPNSLPSSSNIRLLLLYTPDIVNLYPDSLDTYFSDLQLYLNQSFSDSGVRIQIDLVTQAIDELDLGTPPYEEKLASLPALMAQRVGDFEELVALNRIHQPNAIGLLATPLSYERGRSQGISAGRNQGHFWATNDNEVIAHELGHILGADHDFDNSFYKLHNTSLTYNFSFGFIEPQSGVGTVMSYAGTTQSIYSGMKPDKCPLASCGELTLEPEQGASIVDTFNLRRFFIAEAKERDSDLDGISDWFVNKYPMQGGSIAAPYRCRDYDGDGFPNISEFNSLTDPTSAESKPEQADIASDCPAPVEKTFQFVTDINKTLELDLRQYTAEGELIHVYPETEGIIVGLSWDIYGSGLYRYTPTADYRGDVEMKFIADNGVGGKVVNTVYVKVGLENGAPTASISGEASLTLGQTINLNGSESQDPDGDELNYQWILLTKPTSSQLGSDLGINVSTSFKPDVVGEYRVELTVSDGSLSNTSNLILNVAEKPVAPNEPDNGSGGGGIGWVALMLLSVCRFVGWRAKP